MSKVLRDPELKQRASDAALIAQGATQGETFFQQLDARIQVSKPLEGESKVAERPGQPLHVTEVAKEPRTLLQQGPGLRELATHPRQGPVGRQQLRTARD